MHGHRGIGGAVKGAVCGATRPRAHTVDECRQGRAEAQRGLSRLQIWRGYYNRLTCCAHIATEARLGTDGIRPGGGSGDLRRQIQQLSLVYTKLL